MKQCARVVAVDGDSARVLPDGSRCPGCAGGHCKRSLRTVAVANPLGLTLRVSDTVEIYSSALRGLVDLAILLLIPAAGAAAAALLGTHLFGSASAPAIAGFALLGAAVGGALLLVLGPCRRQRSLPQVSAVLSNQDALDSVPSAGRVGGSGGPESIVSSGSNS